VNDGFVQRYPHFSDIGLPAKDLIEVNGFRVGDGIMDHLLYKGAEVLYDKYLAEKSKPFLCATIIENFAKLAQMKTVKRDWGE
jgi:hypothetical protein